MLSKRLKSIVKYVDNCDRVIDIGCDHALLDIYLVKNNYLSSIIVSDIHNYALESGILNIKRNKLQDKIDARLGNGLNVLNDNDLIDTIIISGMGTKTILDILNSKYLNNINKLILQSNRDYDILRKEVCLLGFYIEFEEVVFDNHKIYINIIFKRGSKNYSDIELKYGTKCMINKNIYYDYLKNKNNEIISKIDNDTKKRELVLENEVIDSLM